MGVVGILTSSEATPTIIVTSPLFTIPLAADSPGMLVGLCRWSESVLTSSLIPFLCNEQTMNLFLKAMELCCLGTR